MSLIPDFSKKKAVSYFILNPEYLNFLVLNAKINNLTFLQTPCLDGTIVYELSNQDGALCFVINGKTVEVILLATLKNYGRFYILKRFVNVSLKTFFDSGMEVVISKAVGNNLVSGKQTTTRLLKLYSLLGFSISGDYVSMRKRDFKVNGI
jgi:hypothetical protein